MENEIINNEVMEDVTGELIAEECVKADRRYAVAFGLGSLAVVGGIIFYNKVAKPFIAKLRNKRAQIESDTEDSDTNDGNEETDET